mgnify:CR=1 FL=1
MLSKNRVNELFLVCVAIIILSVPVLADRTRGGVLFLLIGPGARATGMGEAFVAIADDPTATYWNPAGLGRYPLSSQWIDMRKPPGEKVIAIATVKAGLIDIDYRTYDIWAATDSGLYLLDGKKWVSGEIYNTSEEESMTDIIFHYIDGISYDSTLVYEKIIPAVLLANNMEQMPEGFLPPETKIKIPFAALVEGKVTALYGDKKELWVGTDVGLFVRKKGRWERENDSQGPIGKKVNVIAKDERGYLFAGTDNGLFMRKGARWVRFTSADGLPDNTIYSIFIDSHKDVWAGTGTGPAKLKGDKWKASYTIEPPPDKDWFELVKTYFPVEEPHRLDYIVAEIKARNDALDTERPKPGSRVEIPYFLAFESPVTAIYMDKYRKLWFGSELGLKAFDNNKSWEFYGWSTTTIEEETDIKDWCREQWPDASEELIDELENSLRYYNRLNLHRFEAGSVIGYPKSPVSGKITALESAPDGNILVGTEYGTLIFDRTKSRFRYYVYGGLKDEQLENIIRHGNEYWFNTGNTIKVYSKGKSGISFMHVQWLPTLAPDLYYEFLSGTTYLEGWGTVGGAITYINEGENIWTDEAGNELGTFSSYELAAAGCYGTRLTEELTAGLTFKLIYSALAPGVTVGLEQEEGTATTFAVDGGFQYDLPLRGLTVGASVQNIGPDIHDIDAAQADPLPRNLKLGFAWRILDTDYNRLTIAADINKDLINWGNDPPLKEFREAVKNIGAEYSYANFITLRGGYMVDYDYIPTESSDIIRNEEYDPAHWKGIHYFTVGAGINFKNFAFDFGYIPLQEDEEEGKLVLSNILRYSVSVAF